jgi:Armadillo/beta-catenin-like repeat
VVDAGAVSLFVQLLVSPDLELSDQAVRTLGNIASASPETRDIVLKSGVIAISRGQELGLYHFESSLSKAQVRRRLVVD